MARRINFLLGAMLCVSALVHGTLPLMFDTQAVTQPSPAKYPPVRVMGERAAAPRTPPTTQVQPSPRQAEAPLPKVKLPSVEHRAAIHREAEAKRKVKPPSLDRQPQPLPRPAKKMNREVDPRKPLPAAAEVAATGKGELHTGQVGGGSQAAFFGDTDINGYLAEVARKIERNKEYPRLARAGGIEGRATVRFQLLANGHIRPPEVAHSSGHAILDQSALKAVNRAAPFAPPPVEISAGGAIRLEVVLVFQLH